MQKHYDILIIGGGVSGTALFYTLSAFTQAKHVGLIERYEVVAQVSSKATNNSQTLHVGDIETHYSASKAESVKGRSELLARFVDVHGKEGETHQLIQRMVLAVGEKEVEDLKRHHQAIKHLFKGMRYVEREELATLEPAVVEGRDEDVPIAALYTEKGYVMNYERIAQTFLEVGKKPGFDVFMGTRVVRIEPLAEGFRVHTSNGVFQAKRVVVASGAYSLGMAHDLGYASDLTMIPVAGLFYQAPRKLKGKVYAMQIKGLPFAAIHGDPDVLDEDLMRFGPIPIAMPLLEPRNWKTMVDFARQFTFDLETFAAMVKINADPKLMKFLFKSFVYRLPWIGKRTFVKDVRKIVPSMRVDELTYGHDLGGIRPQVVDKKKKVIRLGVAKIHGNGIIFNVTPSPGASVCLASAIEDAAWLDAELNGELAFKEAKMKNMLNGNE